MRGALVVAILVMSTPAWADDDAGLTGSIRIGHQLRAVQVDGKWVKTHEQLVTVPCGRHHVRAGMRDVELEVPCGRVVDLNGELVATSEPPPFREEPVPAEPPFRDMQRPPEGYSRHVVFVELTAGASLRSLFGVSMLGPQLSFAISRRWESYAIEAMIDGFYGSAVGLPFVQARLGPLFEVAPYRGLFLGIGPYLYLAELHRITVGDSLWGLSFGGRLSVRCDLWRLPRNGALYAAFEMAADTTLWGGSLAVGARF